MSISREATKFGFYDNETNTFYYFESEEEFRQMMGLIEESQLEDQILDES